MPNAVADIFRQAAELNIRDPRREGSTVYIEDGVEMLVAGDIHGRRDALTKIIAYAAVDRLPHRRVVLQEITHGPIDPNTGQDRSIELLMRAARLKVTYPDQVLFVLSNHDLSQVTGNEIVKSGRRVCLAFTEGVKAAFGEDADEVLLELRSFLLSMPLALRTPGGVFITHSLPYPDRMEVAGVEILMRVMNSKDLVRGGGAYEWVWGRNQTDEQLDDLAEKLGVDFFILGHKQMTVGWEPLGHRAVTLASDNDHGAVVQFGSQTPLTAETVADHIKLVAALQSSV